MRAAKFCGEAGCDRQIPYHSYACIDHTFRPKSFEPRDDPMPYTIKPKVVTDPVTAPPHYTDGDVECVDVIRQVLGADGFADYCRGSAIAYLFRAGAKVGSTMGEDVAKADWYLSWINGKDPRK
jgi:hypothetical protein